MSVASLHRSLLLFLVLSSFTSMLFSQVPTSLRTRDASGVQSLTADPNDQYWDDQFGDPSPGLTFAITSYNGQAVFGGDWLARSDGKRWYGIGGGVGGGRVYALAVMGSDLYVGGEFTSAGGDGTIKYLAKWNGSSWSNVGTGVTGTVRALAVWGGNLYVGGEFTSAGGMAAGKIFARWNGASWDSLGGNRFASTSSPYINALMVMNNQLVVAGRFLTIAGLTRNNIALYNGSSYDSLASPGGQIGVTGSAANVRALATDGSILYVGGDFSGAGSMSVNSIARWTPAGWDSLGKGVRYYSSGTGSLSRAWCYSLAYSGGQLYVGGLFDRIGTDSVESLARWDGSVWHPLGTAKPENGVSLNQMNALYHDGTNLWIGGDFGNIGYARIPYAARWNGTRFYSGTNGFIGVPNSTATLAMKGDSLLVTGAIEGVGGSEGIIGVWNGNEWTGAEFGKNSSGMINMLLARGPDLYAGGYFSTMNCVDANDIVRWNGSAWTPLGAGLDNRVGSAAFWNDTLYVTGDFTFSDATYVPHIAKWNGTVWQPVGTGLNALGFALASYKSGVIAGGGFTNAGGTASYLAQWDGSAWTRVGGVAGPNGSVYALDVAGDNLYVAGGYQKVGTNTVNSVARWDGTAWSDLGTGILTQYGYGYVYAITHRGSDVIVGGDFTAVTQQGDTLFNIGLWDGAAWHRLGSGMNASISGLAVRNDAIYAIGPFTSAGGKSSTHIAAWIKPVTMPSAPSLVTTADTSGAFTSILLRWSPAGEAAIYQVQLSTDSTFATTNVNDSSVYAVDKRISTPPSGKVFWRVRARNSAGTGPWSSKRSFTNSSGVVLAQTTLVSPADGASNLSNPITFSWNAVSGATGYDIQVATDTGFTTIANTGTNVTGTSQQFSVNLVSPTYYWRVRARDGNGPGPYSARRSFSKSVTGVDADSDLPTEFALRQNFPNPFNPATQIRFDVPKTGPVRLVVYNLLGEIVSVLAQGERAPGVHTVTWNATTAPSGMYIVRMEAGGFSASLKIALVR